jgi:aryl-alcohol dehydrogenase-like predicted oxidoreductase
MCNQFVDPCRWPASSRSATRRTSPVQFAAHAELALARRARVLRGLGGVSTAVAIAWLLARSSAMLPIPGIRSVAHLDDNWAARTLALTPGELAAISDAR